ncbi:MAG: MFS transporter [Actinomycetota bacterium]
MPLPNPDVATRAAWATFAVFALNGFALSTWIARLPAVRDQLALRPAQVGAILFIGSMGSTVALPLAGWVIERIGIRRTVIGAATTTASALAVVALMVAAGQPAWVAVALFAASAGVAGWDVAMNVEGTVVERGVGRAIMPRFHAGFSVGTVGGALLGAATARFGVPLQVHIPVVMVLTVAAVAYALRWFISDPPEVHEHHEKPSTFAVWREPRTLLVGFVVLAAGLTEGAANDWVALAVVDGFEQPNAVGALAFALFVAFMTLMRMLGTGLLERHGRVNTLRVSTGLAIAGLLLFTLSPSFPLALAGVALWGLGAALGFPVGMSAASDEPARAAARISVVATIGYTAFMAGPPLIGLLAEVFGYRGALLFVAIPLAVSFLLIPATRPLAPRRPGPASILPA